MRFWIVILLFTLAACERAPERAASSTSNEGKAAQSAGGASSDEGKALRR